MQLTLLLLYGTVTCNISEVCLCICRGQGVWPWAQRGSSHKNFESH